MRLALIKAFPTYANWYRQPMLGLSYLSAYLESMGHEAKIFDAYFQNWSSKELYRQVLSYAPELIGFSAMTHEIQDCANLAAELKEKRNVPAVIGGPHVIALPEQTLAEFPVFDYGVFGEGEYTLTELVNALEQGKTENLNGIKGLIRHADERILVNESRPFLTSAELNKLPWPAFHHYYGENRQALKGKEQYYVMFTSRGCPYRCAFCMQVLGRQMRRRSPESVLSEMEMAAARFGAHTFNFADEIFLTNTPQSFRMLENFIDLGYHRRFRWSGLTRANFVTEDLISLAKQAGCYRLEMGVESGDSGILKHIDKRITLEQVREAVRVIKKHKISLGTYYILGHPYETPETARKTIELAISLNTDTIAVGIMVPYPGTRVYEMAQRGEGGYRLLSKDWKTYDKYGGMALGIDGLPYDIMQRMQKLAIIKLYLKNFRLIDAARYFWKRRQAIYYLLKKRIFAPGEQTSAFNEL